MPSKYDSHPEERPKGASRRTLGGYATTFVSILAQLLPATVLDSTRGRARAPDARSGRTARLKPHIRNCGRAGRPPIAQRPLSSVSSRAVGETKKTNDPPEPGTRSGSTRRQQPFELLEPEAGVARPLVELDPRYALIPQVGSQHGALHSACAPGRSRGRCHLNIAPRFEGV
jgi:hypothetical protein